MNIQKLIGEGHTQTAIDKYRGATTLITRAIARGLDDHIRQGAGIENALRSHGDRELVVLTNNLGILSMLAKITPLLGLLGTILGMIDAFTILEKSGVNRSGLTGAVRQALVASAAGLLIAIPCVIALSFFRGLIRRHVAEAEAILDGVARSVSTGVEKKAEKTTETVKEEQFELPSILSGKPAG
ncbi:MAG: MotA/TolQ/ExbB proton channel family protein [Planctomycetes bacterium]|nr:MotA/TolQ/ExbB proton channel family protein [Planctomycetota bacterium]